jgi:hypothetical protein
MNPVPSSIQKHGTQKPKSSKTRKESRDISERERESYRKEHLCRKVRERKQEQAGKKVCFDIGNGRETHKPMRERERERI